jgi:RNA polymerase sigma factor (sigma-70 family)
MDSEIRGVSAGGAAAASSMPATQAANGLETDWPALVESVRRGDEHAMEALYQVFGRGVRLYLYRQLGPQDVDDRVHDAFLIVVQAIQRGELREPERLMGFVRTIVRRQVATHIDELVHNRKTHQSAEPAAGLADRAKTPEQAAVERERTALMLQVLNSMSARDREILTRFYLRHQTQEQICRDMRLTSTQYRLSKSRAKQRFGEVGRRMLGMD